MQAVTRNLAVLLRRVLPRADDRLPRLGRRPVQLLQLYLRDPLVPLLLQYVGDRVEVPRSSVMRFVDAIDDCTWEAFWKGDRAKEILQVDRDRVRLTEVGFQVYLHLQGRLRHMIAAELQSADDEEEEKRFIDEVTTALAEAESLTLTQSQAHPRASRRPRAPSPATPDPASTAEAPDSPSRAEWAPPSEDAQVQILTEAFRKYDTVVPHLMRFLGAGPRTKAETHEHMLARPCKRPRTSTGSPGFDLSHYKKWRRHGQYAVVEEYVDEESQEAYLRLTDVAQRVYDDPENASFR